MYVRSSARVLQRFPQVQRATLGAFDQAAWDAYQATGKSGAWSGPPNGSLVDPNGGTIYFNEFGQQDSYKPAAGSSSDNFVEQNTASTFYGWTELQKAALVKAQSPTTPVLTDTIRAGAIVDPVTGATTYSAASIAASDAQLASLAQNDPLIQQALNTLKTGAYGSDVDARSAINIAANTTYAAQDRQAYEDAIHAAGGTLATPATVTGALDAITAAGGDPRQWTSIVDASTGTTVAIARVGPTGKIEMQPGGGGSFNLADVGNKVTGFIDKVAGTISSVGTEVSKVGNAIKGAEAGAQAGYNLPANWRPWALGIGAFGLALMLSTGSRRR